MRLDISWRGDRAALLIYGEEEMRELAELFMHIAFSPWASSVPVPVARRALLGKNFVSDYESNAAVALARSLSSPPSSVVIKRLCS